MYCPRLDHFVRFNQDGTVGKCGHMIDAPGFSDWREMQQSDWLSGVRAAMDQDRWPSECFRCRDTEPSHSVRLASIEKHKILAKDPEYIILGGVLDNICNSACQSCNPRLSTKIGSLHRGNQILLDNSNLLDRIPLHRVVEVDINGGEPTISPNYQKLLENLPDQVRVIRVNTNGGRVLPGISRLLQKKIAVIVTLSLDGIGAVHDYVRWPISWKTYLDTVSQYQSLREKHSNLILQSWTTLHILNAIDFDNIKDFTRAQRLDHDWAYLEQPRELSLKYTNSFSQAVKHLDPMIISSLENNQDQVDQFIISQDKLRGINIKDYI